MTQAANYSARKMVLDGVEVVQLTDAARHIEVSIAVSVGNMAYAMKANGKNVLVCPYHSPAELKAKPTIAAFHSWLRGPTGSKWMRLAEWQEVSAKPRLRQCAPGKKWNCPPRVSNFSPAWTLVSASADRHSASSTSRLEFWKYPEMMAQFPFAHTITMTYRLANGALEVETTLQNLSAEPMPVAIGFHPYFNLHDTPRDQWKVHLAARDHLVLTNLLVPTGERKPVEFADPLPLQGVQLDDVFSNLVRGPDGRAQFWVEGKKERITVTYGPKFHGSGGVCAAGARVHLL